MKPRGCRLAATAASRDGGRAEPGRLLAAFGAGERSRQQGAALPPGQCNALRQARCGCLRQSRQNHPAGHQCQACNA
jgi:hypothetical protein